MIQQYEKYQRTIVATMEVPEAEVSRFGICAGPALSERVVDVKQMIEKPKLSEAPSRDAIVGRYILSPAILPILDQMVKSQETGAGGEIQLTDALAKLIATEGVCGYRFEGERFDAGAKDGWLMANISEALKRPDIAETLIPFMRRMLA
jgi:UTP--glucose-1-phosphate uridylyltransferase